MLFRQGEPQQLVRNIATLTPSVESVESLTSISKRRSAPPSEVVPEREDIAGQLKPSVETKLELEEWDIWEPSLEERRTDTDTELKPPESLSEKECHEETWQAYIWIRYVIPTLRYPAKKLSVETCRVYQLSTWFVVDKFQLVFFY